MFNLEVLALRNAVKAGTYSLCDREHSLAEYVGKGVGNCFSPTTSDRKCVEDNAWLRSAPISLACRSCEREISNAGKPLNSPDN